MLSNSIEGQEMIGDKFVIKKYYRDVAKNIHNNKKYFNLLF